MAKHINQIKKNIMRRVYYAYALRLTFHPVTLHSILVIGSIALMTPFVSFPNVAKNLMNLEISRLPTWTYNALTSTEIWTLLLLGVICFTLLSLQVRLRMPKLQTAPAY